MYAFQQKPEKASPKQRRHLDFISQYTTDIRHVKGTDNIVADAMSRIDTIAMPSPLNYQLLANKQQKDKELQSLLNSTKHSLCLKKIELPETKLSIYCDTTQNTIRPYLPQPLRKEMFDYLHGISHPGVKATRKLISNRYIWPTMNKEINNWTKSCLQCQKTKIQRHTKAPLGNYETPVERFKNVSIDLVGPLPPCKGYKYILTCIDRFTRWAEAIPIEEITAEEVATAFFEGQTKGDNLNQNYLKNYQRYWVSRLHTLLHFILKQTVTLNGGIEH